MRLTMCPTRSLSALSLPFGTGGVGQLTGEDERQRCREQRGERSRSVDQLWVQIAPFGRVGVGGEGIGVVLMWGATVR